MQKLIKHISLCMLSAAMLTACGNGYVKMPSGTNETSKPVIEVPERYLKPTEKVYDTDNGNVDKVETETPEDKAESRLNLFIDKLNSETLYVELTQVKTAGENNNKITMQLLYTEDGSAYKYYNKDGILIAYVIGDNTSAYKIDTEKEVKYKGTSSDFNYIDRGYFVDKYTLPNGFGYTETVTEDIDGLTLSCDVFKDEQGNTVRYCYDTTDGLILVQKIKEDTMSSTLFNKIQLVEVDTSMLIIPEYTEEAYVAD